MKRGLLLSLLAGGLTTVLPPLQGMAEAATSDARFRVLPERLLSGYTGWFLGTSQQEILWTYERLRDAAFNSVEVKIQDKLRTFNLEGHLDEVEDLMRKANEHDLIFQLYLYPTPHDGKRHPDWSEHACLPCVVDRDGKALEETFLLTDARCWKQLFFPAFKFLACHERLPFASLKFDLETITAAYSYDDANWRRFTEIHRDLDPEMPSGLRANALKTAGLSDSYERFFREETGRAISSFLAALRAIDPDVILGYMPAGKGSFHYHEIEKHLATDRIPAIIDNWTMYNGEGYVDATAEIAERTKRVAAGNRSIPWIRPNSYRPDDIAPAVYQAACHTGGYSIWTLKMLYKGGIARPAYALPKGTTLEDYYAAFRKANLAVRADIREGTLAAAARIPRGTIKPLSAPLDWGDIDIPDLKPVGDGSGLDQFICTRERATFYIWAESGQDIKIAVRHDAAEKRPISLHYILMDDRKGRLREEVVMPGASEEWSVTAPKTGVYAFVITGGQGGQAWYSVKIGNGLHYALDARSEGGARIFRDQAVVLPGREYGNAKVRLSCGSSTVLVTPDGRSPFLMQKSDNIKDIDLELSRRFTFATHPEIGYFDAVDVMFPDGDCAFVWGSVGRGLAPNWGMRPLGEAGTLNLPAILPKKPDLATEPRVWPTGIFRDDTVCGVIVSESEDTRLLAEELKWHFDRMSGTKTEIVTSVPSDVPSVVLRRGGEAGESRFRREGRALVLEGEKCGLSHAVTYLLEAMGCRYLWPGRLGKVIPRTEGLRLPEIEFSFKPAFRSRNIRQPSFAAANGELEKKLGFTHDETEAYDRLRAQAEIDRPGNRDFFAWHGVAKEDDSAERRQWGHAFTDYYRKYGESDPDYFALQPDGTRRVDMRKLPNRPTFCLSNAALARRAADDIIAEFKRDPKLSVASVCLPDGGMATECLCASCRRMDPSNGGRIRLWVRKGTSGFRDYVSLTDRTLTFANRVAEMVVAACPGKRLSLYAYANYTDPPVCVKPHPALVILSVTGSYETVDGRAAVERNLAGWLSFGNEILWRPNTLIGFRLAAPQCVGARQFADLEKAKANGVTGADVCASSSQWACRPFDAYFSAKGLLNPDRLDFETIADDFCRAGFGSAAREMRAYLDALVEMGDKAAAEPQDPIVTTTGPSIMKGYVKAFDPERLEKILNRAESAARGDATVLKRLAFLRFGIVSGRLTAAIGRARMEKGDVVGAQQAFVAFLRQTMMREPLAVAPYWSASNFYEPHMRGYVAGGSR